jgi:serine/threonine-protein kinase
MIWRRRIGPYAIVERLGAGAMGEVFRATDTKMFGRSVALKILSERLSRDRHARARFRREVEVASRLVHPNIVAIHDRGEVDDRPFFVMEYLDGPHLGHVVRDPAAFSLERRIELARQVCEALAFAHRHQVVHRDVKPSNVVLVGAESDPRVKLLDFGIVHVERSKLTRSLTQPGTYSYMAPEQLRNEQVDARSDLFALGIVLYELFAGVHPFDAATEPLVAGRILSEDPAPPRRLRPELPGPLEQVILKLLDKDPVQRPGAAEAVSEALVGIRRRLDAASIGPDDDPAEGLDELNRRMVQDLRAWGRRREVEGRLEEALRAYEKALGLAPDSERLLRKVGRLRHRVEAEHELRVELDRVREALDAGDVAEARDGWRRAWILSPDHPIVRGLELRLLDAETDGELDPERDAFVREKLVRAETALDDGRTSNARRYLVEVLDRYPDDALARFLLDRSREIESSGVDYGPYRAELREAESALSAERYRDARDACMRASRLWPDDEEWRALDARIAGRVDARIAEAIARGERCLRDAERAIGDPDGALTKVTEVVDAAERADRLGAPEAWVRPWLEEARRLEGDVEQRRRRRTRLEQERTERSARILADALGHARASLERARTMHGEEDRREEALFQYQLARDELVRALHENPEHPEAIEHMLECDRAVEILEEAVEDERARRADRGERLRAARAALESARILADGDRSALERGLDKLRTARDTLAPLVADATDIPDAIDLTTEVDDLATTLERRRDHETRRAAELEQALQDGEQALAEARRLAGGGACDVRDAERACRRALRAFARALTIEDGVVVASDGREEAETLREHLSAELQRRGVEPAMIGAEERGAPPHRQPDPETGGTA